jgi:hypothetical protein
MKDGINIDQVKDTLIAVVEELRRRGISIPVPRREIRMLAA